MKEGASSGKTVPVGKDADKKKLWGRLAGMATATNAFKRALEQHPKDSHVVDLMKLKPEEAQLKMGDSVSLFSIEANGYLISEGYERQYFNIMLDPCMQPTLTHHLNSLSALSIPIAASTQLATMGRLPIGFLVCNRFPANM